MVKPTFEEAFSQNWVKENIKNSSNELVILRQLIPWEKIIKKLVVFYCEGEGRIGKSPRVMVALLVIARLRNLSDEVVVSQVKENRYIQYFCNVADEGLHTFINPSSLCKFRKRLGSEGAKIIEEEVFERLRRAEVIRNDAQLIDSTVMEDNIIHPTDVLLLHKAFVKMGLFAKDNAIPVWWDEQHLKKRWKAFNFAKKKKKVIFLWEFYLLFSAGLQIFSFHVEHCNLSDKQREKGRVLLAILTVLDEQTQLKLEGEIHIENRIVSLDEINARPIKKGKSYPSCEFGTTLQISFNRDGFMITAENFIGKPNDTTLYLSTMELYRKRMKNYPEVTVTDLGSRSRNNFKKSRGKVQHVFLGRSEDVAEEKQDFCRRARSATEGFIAVSKNWRGFGRSLYRGFGGDKIWTFLCQSAYNLKKFLQLYKKDKIEEKSLVKLGLLSA